MNDASGARPRGRRATAILVAGVLVGLSALPAAQGPPDDFEARLPRPFTLPLARHARTRAEDVVEHLDAERWNAALAELQKLLVENRGDLLPSEWRANPDLPSQFPTYSGASEWARRVLFSLSPQVRARYEERYGPRADEALADALARGGRGSLIAVARRWPLAVAAETAWWTLGDLELERGHPEDARFAWERAHELTVLSGREIGPAAEERLRVAREVTRASRPAERADFREAESGARRNVAPAAPQTIPPVDADTWSVDLDMTPFGGTTRGRYYHNMRPVLFEGRVLVNTSYFVHAVDAYSGAMLWSQGPPEGWELISSAHEYFDQIDVRELTLQPAVRSGVVVAALQIPYTRNPDDSWQNVDITKRIPERRLYAFDLETGEELWNHLPVLDLVANGRSKEFRLDESKNDYARKMLTAASPVIVGGRVLVPCYRLQGRIDYHVACYELVTGELLWSTGLISGQRERNMFGGAASELTAAPLVVADDKVIAQTELGAVAALDLLTGDILWESEYHQMSLRKADYHQASTRNAVWQVAAPLVMSDLVLSTPYDSAELWAFELEDGRVLWGHRQADLMHLDQSTWRSETDLLLGADRDTVYLAGEMVAALQKPGGFRTPGDFRLRWATPLYDHASTSSLPYPVFAEDAIVVPHEDARLVLDRWTGERRRSLSGPWSSREYGNTVVGDGVMFTVGRRQLNGFFDWEVLIAHQRGLLAANPRDTQVVLDTAALFTRRARTAHADGETKQAEGFAREAESLLEPLIADAGGPAGALRGNREVAEAMHGILRLKAGILVDLADAAGALRALATAQPLASTLPALCETLLQQERILRSSSPLRRLEVLEELERTCASLPIPKDVREDGGSAWLIGEAILRDEAVRGWEDASLEIGLWVLLTRADAHARQRQGAKALRDLHAALDRYGGQAVNDSMSVRDLVSQRISRRLELDGRGAYRPFESDASNLYERARGDEDRRMLEEVIRLYPHSDAAGEANRELLRHAYLRDDAGAVASMIFGAARNLELSEEDRALGLFQLGVALARTGNTAYLRGLLDHLDPTLRRLQEGLDERGRQTIAELPDAPVTLSPPLPGFTHDVEFPPGGHHSYQHDYLGELVPGDGSPEDPRRVHVYLRDRKIVTGYASEAPSREAWSIETPYAIDESKCAVEANRIVVGSRKEIQAYDAAGDPLWSHVLGEDLVLGVDLHSGIALVTTGLAANRPRTVQAFDAHGGVPLWRFPVSEPVGWRAPILGDGTAVFIVKPYNGPSRVIALNLYSGEVRTRFELDWLNTPLPEESAWVEGSRLVVPSFRKYAGRNPYIAVHDLDSGRQVWTVEFEDEELRSVATFGERTYVVTGISRLGRGSSHAGIYELKLDMRSLRSVEKLDVGEEVIGLREHRRTRLAAPYLFVVPTSHPGNTTPVRAIHLPNGRRWVYHLRASEEELYGLSIPMPAVSSDCVAIAYVLKDPRTRLPLEARLEFVDLTGGFHLDSRTIYSVLVRAEKLELRGLDDALFILRKEGPRDTRGLDVLEDVR